jgi:hypothetical protein
MLQSPEDKIFSIRSCSDSGPLSMQELKNNKANPALIKVAKTEKGFINVKYSGSHSTLMPRIFKLNSNGSSVDEEQAIIKCVVTSTAEKVLNIELFREAILYNGQATGIKNRFCKTSGR